MRAMIFGSLLISLAMSVKHVVMFGVLPETKVEEVEALKAGLLSLPKKIKQITSHEIGVDLQLEGGQNHPSGRNRDIVWSATFASKEDYDVYEKHPEHVSVITDLIKPIMIPGSRSAIQYEI